MAAHVSGRLESVADDRQSGVLERSGGVGGVAGSPWEGARTSEEFMRWVFDRSPSAMSVASLDGRLVRINDAYCGMLGYERAELIGASVLDFTHPDDVAAGREFMHAVVAGKRDSSEREERVLCKDGSIVWAHVRVEVIHDAAGEPLYFASHVQDLSDRYTAQDLQHDSERTLRSIIDNTPAIICVKGRDHRYQLVNREFEQAFGVTSEWIVGRSDEEILPAATITQARVKDLQVLDGAPIIQDEETILCQGRQRVFLRTRFPLLDNHGEIHAVCIAATDVTEQRLEERSKRERLNALSRSIRHWPRIASCCTASRSSSSPR